MFASFFVLLCLGWGTCTEIFGSFRSVHDDADSGALRIVIIRVIVVHCCYRIALFIFLLGYPDSNQERQDQNLQCYHYTIAQFIRTSLRTFAKSAAKLQLFYKLANLYAKKNINNTHFYILPSLFSTFNFQLSTFIRIFARIFCHYIYLFNE